jgi:hypothetical protein
MTDTNEPEIDRSTAETLIWHAPIITKLSLAETLDGNGSSGDGGTGTQPV